MSGEKRCPCSHLWALLALGIALLPSNALAKDVRLGDDVVPVFQAIELDLDAGSADYTGSVRVDLHVNRETDTFRFHAESMTLESVTLTQGGKTEEPTFEVGEKGVVTVKTEHALTPGECRLEITFADDFNTDAVGLYRMDYEGDGYSFTQFEADDAREAFPCWDEPGFKFPYQMTLTVPAGHLAITNTPVESQTELEDGRKRIVFQKTKPLPSYLLAIATGPLETVDIPDLGIPGRVVTVKGQSHLAGLAVETTAPLLKALEQYFGTPYPYEKLDLIAVPEYWPGAMENPGAITWADNLLLHDPEQVSIGQTRQLIRINAHELAHMWFGDLVTMQWWDDLWLNESFADWLGDKIASQVYPQYRQELSTVRDIQGVMFQDARPSTTPVRRPIESTDNLLEDVGLAYDKGKAVLGMFEQWLGSEAFRKGVVEYINANAWGNATAGDLWEHLNKASGKQIGAPMATFIEQPGLPMIVVDTPGNGKVKLSQHRFHNYGITVDDQIWQVPVGLRYSVNGETRTQTVLLDQASKTVDLGAKVDWILPNLDANGYYRWNVPSAMLESMSQDASKYMTAKERIAFLSNVTALLQAGATGGDDYLRCLTQFASDREPLVLSTMLDALDGVREAFVPEEEEDTFAVYVRRTLGPALDWCGLTATEGEDETMSLLRPRLVAWLGDEGRDAKVKAFAATQAEKYLQDPGSVDPALAGVVLRLAAHDGDAAMYERYKLKAEGAEIPAERRRFLASLGSFRNVDLQEATLSYAIEGDLRPQEMFTVSQRVGSTPAGRDRLFKWMTSNYDKILERIPPIYASYMTYFAGGCSETRLASAREFFSDPAHQVAGTETMLTKVADQINDCVSLRQREGEAVSRYLREISHEPGD